MKKFMRIALVFALAGATLVGCTKDYSGDISDLNKKVTEQASALSALQTQVGAAQTAADAAAQKAAEALAEAQKKASSADVQAAEERVNAKINDLVNGDVKALKDAVAALEGIKAGERLTDLETAIKDFVTKAEFAQELAALKDELEDAIAAGDKVNADAIAALEKKVEGILAGLSITDVKVYSTKAITAAYGKFTAKGVENAAKWKGPKADEIAKIKKGDFVFGTGANEIIVQVNPADADITGAAISLQTSECTEAPIAFGTPVPCEKLKSKNGLWSLPFVVEEFTEDEAKEISNEFNGAAMSLVVNGVRTDYDMTFKIDEGKTTDAKPDDITEKVAEASGEGTFVFAPTDAPKILDAYITDVADADSLRYGITYDGMSFTYDVEKVQKRVEATKQNVVINFSVSYMNLVGGTAAKTGVLTIAYKAADPVAPTVYQFAAEAAHDAVAFHGTTNAEKEASRAEQALVVDFKEFFDEFAPTKAEKDVWVEDWKPETAVAKFYKAIYNAYDELEKGDEVDDLVVDCGFDRTNSKYSIKFAADYGDNTVAKLDGKDRFVAEITFKNGDDEICALVPFKINKPSDAEIAKWYNWNKLHKFADGVLYIQKASGNQTLIEFNNHFNVANSYTGITLVAPVTPVFAKATDTTPAYYTTGAVLPTFTAAEDEAMKGMDSAEIEDYKKDPAYGNNLNADFLVFAWNVDHTDYVIWSAPNARGVYQRPYYKFDDETGATGYNNLQLYYWHDYDVKGLYLNENITLSGLKVKAMGGREFTIPTLTFQVVGQAPAAENSVEFTPALEIDRDNFSYIGLYNALYEPNKDKNEYDGAFALKNETGKAMKLGQANNSWVYPINTYTATTLDADGNPIWSQKNQGAIKASTFEYQSQINTNGAATSVAGLKLVDNGVDDLNPDVNTLYVKISIAGNAVLYVLDGTAYGTQQTPYEVTFEIKIK